MHTHVGVCEFVVTSYKLLNALYMYFVHNMIGIISSIADPVFLMHAPAGTMPVNQTAIYSCSRQQQGLLLYADLLCTSFKIVHAYHAKVAQ